MAKRNCMNCNTEMEADLPVCPLCGFSQTEALPEKGKELTMGEGEPLKTVITEESENPLKDAADTTNIPEYTYQYTVQNEGQDTFMESDVNKHDIPIDDQLPKEHFLSKMKHSTLNRKNKIAYISVAFVLFVAITAYILITGTSSSNSSDLSRYFIRANITSDETFHFVTNDEVISLDGAIKCGELAPDKKHVAIIEQDNVLYVMDRYGNNKIQIAENVTNITKMNENGFIYEVNPKGSITVETVLKDLVKNFKSSTTYDNVKSVFESRYPYASLTDAEQFYEEILDVSHYGADLPSGIYYRYTFDGKEPVQLGDSMPTTSTNSLSMAWIDDDKIMALRDNSSEVEVISKINQNEELKIIGISKDGSKVVWESVDGSSSIYMSQDGEKTTLGNLETSLFDSYYSYVYFSADGSKVLVSRMYSDRMIEKEDGKDPVVVKLGGILSKTAIYTPEGELSINSNNEFSLQDFYLLVSNDETVCVYHIDQYGDREKISSDIGDLIDIVDGTIFYTTRERELYKATLDGDRLKEEVRITSEVNGTVQVSSNGKYIYYKKHQDDNALRDAPGDLYVAAINNNEINPEKIAEDVLDFKIRTDGTDVVYRKDLVKIGEHALFSSDLYIKNIKSDSEKICSDVMHYATDLSTTFLNPGFFGIYRYSEVDGDDVIKDLGYYDGKEYKKIANDVKDTREAEASSSDSI